MHLNLLIHNEKKKNYLEIFRNILFNIIIILVKYNMIK